jgi:nitrate reductase NapE component
MVRNGQSESFLAVVLCVPPVVASGEVGGCGGTGDKVQVSWADQHPMGMDEMKGLIRQ